MVGLRGESLEADAAIFCLGRLCHPEVFVGNSRWVGRWRSRRECRVDIALDRVLR